MSKMICYEYNLRVENDIISHNKVLYGFRLTFILEYSLNHFRLTWELLQQFIESSRVMIRIGLIIYVFEFQIPPK